ncbi:DUF2178 domain-containing protein [Thermococcus sp. Bubb.Bath]|uniref:DUF2178 domain-containing protein n=1 Tax=Thermococcus sp. Bubb.Bath TaxID=1638242 RepID=UPI00143B4ED4|nr:DUF2178 domain-containing protein [Thermococcus sp. Bubb.Bath]
MTALYIAAGYRRNAGEDRDERTIRIDQAAAEKTILLIQTLVVVEILYVRFITGDRESPAYHALLLIALVATLGYLCVKYYYSRVM